MDLEHNKRVALAFVESMGAGHPDPQLLCDDVTWWVPGMGTVDRDGFFRLVKGFHELAAEPMRLRISAVTAEADRVAIEASGSVPLKDGRTYANTYHFLFHLRDGRIAEVKEHNNSIVPATLFGGAFERA